MSTSTTTSNTSSTNKKRASKDASVITIDSIIKACPALKESMNPIAFLMGGKKAEAPFIPWFGVFTLVCDNNGVYGFLYKGAKVRYGSDKTYTWIPSNDSSRIDNIQQVSKKMIKEYRIYYDNASDDRKPKYLQTEGKIGETFSRMYCGSGESTIKYLCILKENMEAINSLTTPPSFGLSFADLLKLKKENKTEVPAQEIITSSTANIVSNNAGNLVSDNPLLQQIKDILEGGKALKNISPTIALDSVLSSLGHIIENSTDLVGREINRLPQDGINYHIYIGNKILGYLKKVNHYNLSTKENPSVFKCQYVKEGRFADSFIFTTTFNNEERRIDKYYGTKGGKHDHEVCLYKNLENAYKKGNPSQHWKLIPYQDGFLMHSMNEGAENLFLKVREDGTIFCSPDGDVVRFVSC